MNKILNNIQSQLLKRGKLRVNLSLRRNYLRQEARLLLPVFTCVSRSSCRLLCQYSPQKIRTFRHLQTLSSRDNMPQKKEFSRLSTDVKPVNYALRLKPNLTAFTFEGSENISVEIKTPTNRISLNSAEIEISSATYTPDGGQTVTATVEFLLEEEKVNFTFPADLQCGNGVLAVAFTGILNDKMKGFYRSKYTGPDGDERYAAVTQFEATDARRSFPCWDEPALKATFDVTLVVPKNRVALSNMPVKEEVDHKADNTWKEVTYQRSPIMSTYLLAYVVGEYDYVEGKDADGVEVRVFTPVGKKEQGQFALEVAVKTLPFYKNYFQIAYPLPKMDLIALADFAAGAMENWGLVTYRETALLIDPENSSAKAKQWVALVVGHEIAHQWFGNLVTMEWWTHLWLNEGFASWIEYLCVDHCFPEYDIWTQFVIQDLGRALELDALHTSHPIEVPVGHPEEVDEIFDVISYSKGASVIRMLHDYIGDEDFRKGMFAYLTKFQYSNAFTEDLWESLEAASGKPVAAVMSTWTKQMGFPVIKVSEKREGDTCVLTLEQEKFCADGKRKKGENPQWMVPISITTSSSPDTPVKTILLDSPSVVCPIPNVKAGDWVKLNAGTVGVYRVQYTAEMLARLIPAVKDKSLPARDRLGLQSDLFALTRAGLMPSVEVLKVAKGYINEDNYTVWSDLSLNLSVIARMLQYTDANEDYKKFALKLFGPIAETLGWDAQPGEGHLEAMLRDLVLTKLGRYGNEPTVAMARKRFEDHCAGTKALPADLRVPVYTTVLTHGDEETFNKMLKLYDDADMQEEKVRISRILGAIKQDDLMKKVLDFSLSEKVRSMDSVFVIAGLTGTAKGRQMAWEFMQTQWPELFKRYESGQFISRLVKSISESFVTEEKATEVEAFFEKNPAPAAERTIKQSCENIRLNSEWLKRESADVCKFLKEQ